MTDREKAHPDTAATLRLLGLRAGDRGYHLTREPGEPCRWTLLDAQDGEPLHSASSLAEIARFLDE
ncbi:hypothetical protein [Nocardia sp. NBC_00416]|uniref:hypothetical protein n=1 Tax=Nocardia sp. NBC_00416 TaxID=2975991 RepID=UPI002E1F6765